MNTSTKVSNNPIAQNLSLENLENEIWKDIPNYEGFYQISNLGRVKSLRRKRFNKFGFVNEKIIKNQKTGILKKQYYSVNLYKNGKRNSVKVHLLSALTFLNHTTQINEIVDVIIKYFGDRGINLEFPNIESLMNKK